MTTPLDELAEYMKDKPGTLLFEALFKYDSTYVGHTHVRRSRAEAALRLPDALREDFTCFYGLVEKGEYAKSWLVDIGDAYSGTADNWLDALAAAILAKEKP